MTTQEPAITGFSELLCWLELSLLWVGLFLLGCGFAFEVAAALAFGGSVG